MKRRTFLAVGCAGLSLIAGCGSDPRPRSVATPTPAAEDQCADRTFPERHIGVIQLEPTTPPETDTRTIRFGDLPADERAVLERALNDGRYAICLPAASEDRISRFNAVVERVQSNSESMMDRPYLKYEGSYYQFVLVRSGDQVYVTAGSLVHETDT